jgi:hypothetical protein
MPVGGSEHQFQRSIMLEFGCPSTHSPLLAKQSNTFDFVQDTGFLKRFSDFFFFPLIIEKSLVCQVEYVDQKKSG